MAKKINVRLGFVATVLATTFATPAMAWNQDECIGWLVRVGTNHADCPGTVLPSSGSPLPTLTANQYQAMEQRQQQAQRQAQLQTQLAQALSQNDIRTAASIWAQMSPDMRNSVSVTPEQRVALDNQIQIDNSSRGNTTTTTTTTNTKVISSNPVQAYLQSLPALPQATTDSQYICEYRGKAIPAPRNIFFNGTRTEGPVNTGLNAFTWQYATKKGSDGKTIEVDEFGEPRKFAYSRIFLSYGGHKLPENMIFQGEMGQRVTPTGIWVEVGEVVKYTHLTSAAAFNGSWALAFGKEDRQGSVAAGSGGTISDRVAVEVKSLNQACILNAGELTLIERALIPPPPPAPPVAKSAPKAPETTVAVELVKDEKEVRLPLVHAIGAKPAATPWGACGRDPRTGAVITVTEAEYKAGKRCPAEVTDRKVEYHLRGPGSVAQPLQVLTPANPAPAAQ